jgi:RsiW-degrading membrane proteinase PrsW (M82 family)
MRYIIIRIAIFIVIISGPIFLGGLGYGFYLISTVAPLWVFVILCLSGVIVALGFAFLLDERSPLENRRQHDL